MFEFDLLTCRLKPTSQLMQGDSCAPWGTDVSSPQPRPPSATVSPQIAPSPRIPAAGAPTPWPTDGHPRKHPGENTSHRPAEPEPERQPDTATEPAPEPSEAARALVAALPHLSPDLRRIPRGMHDELARLISRWLAAGHAPTAIRTHILRGLPDDGTPVRRPGGPVPPCRVPPLPRRGRTAPSAA